MAFNSTPLYPFYQASYRQLNSYLADDRKRKRVWRKASEVGNEQYNNRGDASAHLCDDLLCSLEGNSIVLLAVRVPVSVLAFSSIKSVLAC